MIVQYIFRQHDYWYKFSRDNFNTLDFRSSPVLIHQGIFSEVYTRVVIG